MCQAGFNLETIPLGKILVTFVDFFLQERIKLTVTFKFCNQIVYLASFAAVIIMFYHALCNHVHAQERAERDWKTNNSI